ncbi:MAG: hypothetical protein COW01_15820 [Bdellovibrionales bacterium CG12_big_fil_rev_8_21_14_0_65_38_15]|jgi:hypothetical protein|nr:MAG: hypothetical protein COW79_14985 [Bdellovibrionales bacterium CG22_combo_CG10-13_8_21_14_all_38_13]PIQ52436.1 MAG: hypothetical protein COW01_15820 [Bdellovibrionales bacterium CG12_big_fil_rev_8_21_14_0_65_38_15]PIR29474.1 MAG: hypothetical protein COV38_10360 [Bdellovibrionales bacterium CG11_big_fil_rev_8_21_14_0_20_38_13]
MKKYVLVAALILIGSLSTSYAHGDKHEEEGGMHSEHHAKESPDVVVKGQLIGMTCFIKHQSKGEKHRDCFKDCANKGLPIGILTGDHKIYQISGEGHADLKETNKKFLKYAEEQIVAKGKVFSSNGINMIVVKGIKKAN